MKQRRCKRLLAILMCICMFAVLMPITVFAADLPEGPTVDGDVWTVNPQNAQYTLDGAYGSIDGKNIHFSEGNYTEVLVLARPTKYNGSNTKYYNMNWTQETGWVREEQPMSYEDFIKNPSNIVTYERQVDNVTFTADEGVVLPGFTSSSGHVYGSAYDYVRDVEIVNTTNSYYGICSLNHITFSGLTIKDNVAIANYMGNGDATNSDLNFLNCIFQGNTSQMGDSTYSAIRLMSDTQYFNNIKVSDCQFTNYFQGIYAQGADGIQVKNNIFDGTTHNAIAIQSSSNNKIHGAVMIEENIIKNANDRAIRFGDATEAQKITVQNNVMVNSGDGNGELIKGDFPDSSVVSLEYNYWDGRDVETAVVNEAVRPENTGIIGGTFSENVDAYKANGYISKDNGDGTFTVELAKDTVTLLNEYGETLTITVEAGKTVTLPTLTMDGHHFQGWYDNDGDKVESYTATTDGSGKVTYTARWEHTYLEEWKTDENHHWHECTCGAKTDVESHSFQWVVDKEATALEVGFKHEECEVCGYQKSSIEIPATETNESEGNNTPSADDGEHMDGPQTGDNKHTVTWITVAVLAAGTMTGIAFFVRKKKAE